MQAPFHRSRRFPHSVPAPPRKYSMRFSPLAPLLHIVLLCDKGPTNSSIRSQCPGAFLSIARLKGFRVEPPPFPTRDPAALARIACAEESGLDRSSPCAVSNSIERRATTPIRRWRLHFTSLTWAVKASHRNRASPICPENSCSNSSSSRSSPVRAACRLPVSPAAACGLFPACSARQLFHDCP